MKMQYIQYVLQTNVWNHVIKYIIKSTITFGGTRGWRYSSNKHKHVQVSRQWKLAVGRVKGEEGMTAFYEDFEMFSDEVIQVQNK